MKEPLISVIIPAYNIDAYLPRCLRSILTQTYMNTEIIVVNDGSTDGTASVIDEYADKDGRIKAVHKENGGVTSARLRGVAEASGQWISFVDGDDELEPDMYAILMDNAIRFDADISHCGYQMVFPSRVDLYHGTNKVREQDHITGLADLLSGILVEPGLWNKVYKRELVEQLISQNLMNSGIKINEDLLMNFYLFRLARKSVFHDVCKYRYMVRASSAANSAVNQHHICDPLKVTDILLEETTAEPLLREIVLAKLARQLISTATMDAAPNPALILPAKKQALQKLRKQLSVFLKNPGCSMKLKIMVLWTAVWPAGYGWVHRMYEHMTGLDKIYDIN